MKKFGKGFPTIETKGRKRYWIHAVSVGEVKAIAPLAKKLKTLPSNPLIIISTTTETGHKEAKKALPFADHHVYLPFDISWIIRPILVKAAPDVVLLSETDFWYNFLTDSKKIGAKTALVNGKISDKSTKLHRRIPFFSKAILSKLDLLCLQNTHYLKRFQQLGVPQNKMVVTGNSKIDGQDPANPQDQLDSFREKFGIAKTDFVITVGSTHHPEEELILRCLKPLWQQFPSIKLLLVPRHPERFGTVETILKGTGWNWIKVSDKSRRADSPHIILVDAMGMLRQCYQLSDLAIVCGSFTPKIGGHNVLEPCSYGVPVLFGPYMHSQLEMVELINEYGAGKSVRERELAEAVQTFLVDPDKLKIYGRNGLRLMQENRGATEKTLHALTDFIKTN